jgi:DNA-binding transcriptional LysR family regulator
LRDAELSAAGDAADPHGTLVVTASQLLGRLHVIPIVTDLLARYPGLTVRLLLFDRPIRLVEEGVDVAVRIGNLADSALTAVKLGEVRHLLVASPSYLEANGVPQTPADLKTHTIIHFTGLSATDDWRFANFEQSSIHLKPRLVVNTAEAAISAVEAGAGIARLLSYQVSEAVLAGRLVSVLDEIAPPAIPMNLLFQAGRGASPNVRAFVDAAKARFREML